MLLLFFILLVGAQKFLSHPAKDLPRVALLKEKKKRTEKDDSFFYHTANSSVFGKKCTEPSKDCCQGDKSSFVHPWCKREGLAPLCKEKDQAIGV